MKFRSENGTIPVLVVITLVVIGAIFFGGLVLYGYVNGLRSEGIRQETGLNAQYLDNQNELSAYISGFYEKVGLANAKSDRMDKILVDAVKGRYEGNNGTPVERGQTAPFFAAIVEAYPDVAGLNIYDKIVDYVSAGREAYKAKQSKLLDMLRSYDAWRQDGFVQSRIVSAIGFPSSSLEARIGTKVSRGMDARDQMYLIVTTAGTKKAYESGEMEPLSVPK